MLRLFSVLLWSVAMSSASLAHGISIPDWLPRHRVTITHDIPIATRGPVPRDWSEQTIRAMLFRPERPGPMPAAVIINSSGGVDGDSELVWANYLAELGIATLVVDSFAPRGIRDTTRNQAQLDHFWSGHDGAAGWRWLARQDFVARERILVLGMSRGAMAAIANAMHEQRRRMRADDTRFAAHIAISPECNIQPRNAVSTGAPIMFLLGELDDYTPINPCLEYAERLRAAGNGHVRRAIYFGGFHAPELPWGSAVLPEAVTWNRCRNLRREPTQDGWIFENLETRQRIPGSDIAAYGRANCLQLGGSVGGDMRLRQQMGADMLRFLMEHEFVRDAEMRRLLPDCAVFPEANGLRRSCQRAGWGWPAEAGRLGWMLRRDSTQMPGSPSLALALTRIAAERGAPYAQAILASWLREGTMGLARNHTEAADWARRADAQGSGGGANELGLLAEAARDFAAARAHFQRSAERYNAFGMANYGSVLATGTGGPADSAAAERWLRLSIHYENPWGHLFLARALEAGQLGRAPDPRAALASFRAAAAIEFPGQADARRQVSRLEAALR